MRKKRVLTPAHKLALMLTEEEAKKLLEAVRLWPSSCRIITVLRHALEEASGKNSTTIIL